MKLSPEENTQVKQMVEQYGIGATLRGYLKSHDVDSSSILKDIGRQGVSMAFYKLFGITPEKAFEEKQPGVAAAEVPAKGATPTLKREEPAVEDTSDASSFMDGLVKLSKTYKVSPAVLLAMIKTESNFDPTAQGTSGERGLLQLMPKTAQAMGLTVSSKQDDRLDAMKNIESALKYMQKLKTHYGAKNIDQMLGGYNAGPSRMKGDAYRQIPSTVEYIRKVKEAAQNYETDPSAAAADLKKLHGNVVQPREGT